MNTRELLVDDKPAILDVLDLGPLLPARDLKLPVEVKCGTKDLLQRIYFMSTSSAPTIRFHSTPPINFKYYEKQLSSMAP